MSEGHSPHNKLRDALQRLAATPEEQDAWLTDIFSDVFGDEAKNTHCEELALELHNLLVASSYLIETGQASKSQIEAVQPLDNYLESLSSQKESGFWAREALFKDKRWELVRQLAKDALKAFPN